MRDLKVVLTLFIEGNVTAQVILESNIIQWIMDGFRDHCSWLFIVLGYIPL